MHRALVIFSAISLAAGPVVASTSQGSRDQSIKYTTVAGLQEFARANQLPVVFDASVTDVNANTRVQLAGEFDGSFTSPNTVLVVTCTVGVAVVLAAGYGLYCMIY